MRLTDLYAYPVEAFFQHLGDQGTDPVIPAHFIPVSENEEFGFGLHGSGFYKAAPANAEGDARGCGSRGGKRVQSRVTRSSRRPERSASSTSMGICPYAWVEQERQGS